MNAPAYNTVAWFQVGTTDAEEAKRFYGALFGWRYTLDPNSEARYHLATYPGPVRRASVRSCWSASRRPAPCPLRAGVPDAGWGRSRSGPEDTPELDDQRAAIRASDRAVSAAAPNRKIRGHRHAERLESAGKARSEPPNLKSAVGCLPCSLTGPPGCVVDTLSEVVTSMP